MTKRSEEEIEARLFDIDEVPMEIRPVRRKPTSFKNAIDEVRTFRGWTLNKLEVFRLYLRMYPRVAGSGNYIDAFAGDGFVKVNGKQHPGSAHIALDSGAFKNLHLFELPHMVGRLTNNLNSHKNWGRCTVTSGNCNITIPDLLQSGNIDRSRPLFAFLDPNSTELDWSTIEALARFKPFDESTKQCKTELWILFNLEQAIRRLWPNDKSTDPPFSNVLDRVMGGRHAWFDLWTEGRSSDHLVYRYCERLDDLGYAFVFPQRILDPVTGAPQYWMIHATDHRAAESFMRWAKVNATADARSQPIDGIHWPDPIGTKRGKPQNPTKS